MMRLTGSISFFAFLSGVAYNYLMKTNRRHTIFLLLAVAALLVLAAASGEAAQGTRPEAPDFEFRDLSGSSIRLSDHRGKVVVLNFWATWCPECINEIPSLSGFAERYAGRGVAVLAISLDKSEQGLRNFLRDRPVRFPVMIDRDGDVYVKQYHVLGLPATIIIDRRGGIAARLLGGQDFLSQEFTKRIDGLLAEDGGKGR